MADKKTIKKTEDKEVKKVVKAKKKAEVVAETAPVDAPPEAEIEVKEEKAAAKAGKRSAKAVKEAEVKEAKAERKKTGETEDAKPKTPVKPPRTRLERAGKKYREVAKLIEKDKEYEIAEALELATKTSPVKFDATVELHVRLAVDPKQADQNVRGTVNLPEGSGKTLRVAVFAEADDAKAAKAAGADIAGADDFLAQLDKNELNFDVLVTSPALMPQLGKYAKVLGPKGLMPNPKSGTITTDIAKAVKSAKAGKVEYRVDAAGIIHLGIGKVSFGAERLAKNAEAVVSSIKAAKPGSIKGAYVTSAYLTTSMGPSIKVNL
jgi:large subunit ribosomal protein L1